jgi:phosphohistidine phosphatase
VNIYFLRHANAGKSKLDPAKDDARPLDSDGIHQAHLVGRLLAALDVQPDAIVSSPLKRARQTASVTANELGFEEKIEITPALHKRASFPEFEALLRDYSQKDSIVLVGHNPNFSEFLGLLLSGGKQKNAVELRKGAVAKVELTGRRNAVLHWCVTPKLINTIYADASKSKPHASRK